MTSADDRDPYPPAPRKAHKGDAQKVNEYKVKPGPAPSAGFEPATPGLGNLLSIRASEHPKTPMNIGFSRSLGLARSGAQFAARMRGEPSRRREGN